MQLAKRLGKPRLAIQLVLLPGLALGMIGCVMFHNRTIDETNQPAWWGQLSKGEILQLKQDTLLNGGVLTLSAYKITDNYDSGAIYGGNITVEKFKANPHGYWRELRILPKGTQLKSVKLLRVFSFEYSRYTVWVEVLDGEFKGKIVELGYFVSGMPQKKGSLVFDTDHLEPLH
ncbi:MAG TPA: hypothetical protein VIK53_00455 [Verrucomicrobiae bacterium]